MIWAMGQAKGRRWVVVAAAVIAALAILISLLVGGSGGSGTAAAGIVPPCLPRDIPAPPAQPSETGPTDRKKPVIFVGNNWEGTADIVSTRGKDRYETITTLNIVPDYDERVLEICANPVDAAYFLAIREAVGEGNDQLVDDMYSTPDGKLLVVSRPSFRDVVAIFIAGPRTGEIKWRFQVDGQRSDHMAVSPDGKQVAVSASTGNVVHLLNTNTGVEEGSFESGDSPHENVYSENGKKIFHASIGMVYTPGDAGAIDTDTSKGDRYFQVVNAKTGEVVSRVDMGQKLDEAGYPDMSAAVRPMALMRHERVAYLQVSFFHGVVKYNLRQQRVKTITELPNLSSRQREEYLLDSAHHGIALSGNDRRLCVAGTESDYATIINRKRVRSPSLEPRLLELGVKPYWATTSDDGKKCYVSWSGTDDISVISYKRRTEIAHIEVGDHPQRIRNGFVRRSFAQANR